MHGNVINGGKKCCSKTTAMSAIKGDLDNTIYDKKSIAAQLSKYFVEVGPNFSNNLPPGDKDFSEYLEPVYCE